MTVQSSLIDLFQSVLVVSLQTTLLAGVTLLAQRGLRRWLTAGWLFALWWVCLLRLAIPLSIESPVSVENLLPFNGSIPIAGAGGERSGGPSSPVTSSDMIAPSAESQAVPSASGSAETGSSAEQGGISENVVGAFSWWAFFAWGWAVGSVAMAAMIVVNMARQWRYVRTLPRRRDPALERLLSECRRTLGVRRRCEMVEVPPQATPGLYGLFSPKILIPRDLEKKLSTDELRYLLLHELAHVKRRDVLANGVIACLHAIHWLNPLLWPVFRRIRHDAEVASDELAVRARGYRETRAYGLALTRLAEERISPNVPPWQLAIIGNDSSLKRRITMLMRFRPASYKTHLIGATIIGALGTLGLIGAPVTISESGSPRAMSEPKAQPNSATGLPEQTADAGSRENDEAANPEAERRFSSGSWEGRLAQAKAVYNNRGDPRPLFQVVDAMDEANAKRLEEGALALGDVEGHPEQVVPRLRRLLGHPDVWVRSRAASGLEDQGKAAYKVIPDLIGAIAHYDKSGYGLPSALGKMGRESGKWTKEIVGALGTFIATSQSEHGRGNAILQLKRFGKAARPAVSDLLEVVDDPDPRVRRLAALAIFKIDPEAASGAKEALEPIWTEIVTSSEWGSEKLRIEAAENLGRFDTLSSTTRSALQEVVESAEHAELRAVCKAVLANR